MFKAILIPILCVGWLIFLYVSCQKMIPAYMLTVVIILLNVFFKNKSEKINMCDGHFLN